jgi:acetylornithine deacetylase
LGDKNASGGIVLSGHTDVVPVDGQDWSRDPFRLTAKDGRLYGRGTTDMKGFLAVVLAMVPEFMARGLRRPVHLAFSYDEEVGCLGVRDMLDHITRHRARPAMAVIGEPTGMQVVSAHKAIQGFETLVTGREAHSSATHVGVNAVMVAADLIGFIDRLGADLRAEAEESSAFVPPHSTVHVGIIEGGTAQNIIPRHCRFVWEYRCLPGGDEDYVLHRFENYARQRRNLMRQIAPEADIVTQVKVKVPALMPNPSSPVEQFAQRMAQQNNIYAVSFGTEAGLFQNAGIPAIVCGPGNILQAHAPNEFIEESQIRSCEAFLRRMMDEVCLPPA